jgi:outer membrane immunogenic protein
MRRVIVATTLCVVGAAMAQAADMRAPAMISVPTPTLSWTGFYAGLNLGGGWAHTTTDFSAGGTAFATAKNHLTGAVGGAQLGYNWQNGRGVFGIEADLQYTGLDGRLDAPSCPAAICGVETSASYRQKMPWFGTVRGRVGYAADTWLIYATAGYAYARLETEASASAGALSASVTRDETRSGLAAGGGVEIAFSRQWSGKLEYLYLDLGKRDHVWAFSGLPTVTESSHAYANIVRAGVNYRF